MVLIIVMGGNMIVFFHGGVSLLTGIAHCVDLLAIRPISAPYCIGNGGCYLATVHYCLEWSYHIHRENAAYIQSIARAFEFCVLRMRICVSAIADCVNSNSRAREVRNVLRARKKGGLLSRLAIQNGLAASCYGTSF